MANQWLSWLPFLPADVPADFASPREVAAFELAQASQLSFFIDCSYAELTALHLTVMSMVLNNKIVCTFKR